VTDVHVRPARRTDVPAVLDLWATAGSPHAMTPNEPGAVERVVDEGSLLVAERDGAVVGALIAAWDGWRGNMYRLAVLSEHRREAIGRALVESGERSLRARGAPRVTALVAREDRAARALWLAVGYEDDVGMGRFVRNLHGPG
jgi:ribosomal protein S18 acetylase RimI-like enzyme